MNVHCKKKLLYKFIYFFLYTTECDLLLKKENNGKIKKIKAKVIDFDQSIDIQTAEEVKCDDNVILAIGDEAIEKSTNSYDKVVRFLFFIFQN